MYTQIRKKIHLKQGGKIPKYQNPYQVINPITGEFKTSITDLSLNSAIDNSEEGLYEASGFGFNPGVSITTGNENSSFGETTTNISNDGTMTTSNTANDITTTNEDVPPPLNVDKQKDSEEERLAKISKGSNIAAQTFNALDNATLGNANFGAQSQAIDGAVHMASGALMKSGNPYAMLAGVALEGVNFLTKAGGQTVQGFDVDIDSSGYGNIGHMESSSSRSWVSHRKLQDKLARRNEQVRTALAAAQISEDQKFESEARMNSVENTIMNNQIALAGGLQTNLLGS